MNRSSLVPFPDARETPDDYVDDDAASERLHAGLLAAAEEEAAAIVEDARQEILATVRRARRDLMRVRTRLQLHGLEPRHITVDGTNALRQVVGHAATELHALSVSGRDLVARALSGPRRTSGRPQIMVMTIVALSVATGLVGWIYTSEKAPSAASAGTRTRTVAPDAAPGRNPAPAPATLASASSVAPQPRTSPAAALGTSGQVARKQIPIADSGPAGGGAASVPQVAGPVQATSPPAQASPVASLAYATPGTAIVQVPHESAPAIPAPVAAPPAQRTEDRPSAPALDDEVQAAIFAKHVQWFDAYGRGDRQAMAGLTATGFSLRDERARSANADAGASTPTQVSDMRIDVAGAGAVLTARLRNSVGGVPGEALLSEVWVRGEQQQWALMGVRITPVDRVPQPTR